MYRNTFMSQIGVLVSQNCYYNKEYREGFPRRFVLPTAMDSPRTRRVRGQSTAKVSATLKFALAPTPTPDASQWNISGVGPLALGLALGMYISCFLCWFPLRFVANANPVSGGIWA